MRIEKVKLYRFEELNEEAKTKALETLRGWNVENCDWYEASFYDWTMKLEEMGYINSDIQFSGFWSQGDGACFSSGIDLAKWLEGRRIKSKYQKLVGKAILTIGTSGRYSHEYSMGLSLDLLEDLTEKQSILLDELTDIVIEEARDTAKQIYRDLEKEYEYMTSDEALTEYFTDNDYDFEANGKMWRERRWYESRL